MGDYDEEEGVHEKEGLRGVACFASDRDDPFITNVVDSDDDSDVEDFTIKENDNLSWLLRLKTRTTLWYATSTITSTRTGTCTTTTICLHRLWWSRRSSSILEAKTATGTSWR
ncbi:hypothetical protein L596_016984 [Steinernema carpocapsae]|uniref:Uncharacterized protein n=1 Tax=Steinernema carpocapsae TaxID=34508 RepID=A0A4U5N108_STECR|nr:hypothetical protein L596_016984 [Steinernema carpocapsae]